MWSSLPPRSFITTVPFVSWCEAARLEYTGRQHVNPSAAASMAMVMKYWEDKPFHGVIPDPPRDWKCSGEVSGTLVEVKKMVAKGVPVIVSPGLTTVAHPIQWMFAGLQPDVMEELGEGHYAGTLGPMISYAAAQKLQKGRNAPGIILRESLFLAERVVVGYDDERSVLVMHCPSMGPAWEVAYETFEAMWAPLGRPLILLYPRDYKSRARADEGTPYRPRGANERAAERFLLGSGYSSIGRDSDFAAAEALFVAGLNDPEVSDGYKHLFLMELATIESRRNNLGSAIHLAKKAIALLPEDHIPWLFLSEAYEASRRGSEAKEATKKFEELAHDEEARRKVARGYPCDFWIFHLAEVRRWCSEVE